MPPTSSSEDRYGLSSVPVLARGLSPFPGATLGSSLLLSSAFPFTRKCQAWHAQPSVEASLWNSPAFMETRNRRANPSLVQKQPGGGSEAAEGDGNGGRIIQTPLRGIH